MPSKPTGGIVIEPGVAMPTGSGPEIRKALRAMQPWDSFETTRRSMQLIYREAKALNIRITSRKIKDATGGPTGQYRVWRIE